MKKILLLIVICLLFIGNVYSADVEVTITVSESQAVRVNEAWNNMFIRNDGEGNKEFFKRTLVEYVKSIVLKYERRRDALAAKLAVTVSTDTAH